MPTAVQDNKGGRPYFPRMFIVADQESGMILDTEIYQSINDDINVILNKLINMFLEHGIPKEIKVRSEAMVAILDDLCNKTGIRLRIVKRLPAIDRIMKEMANRF